MRISTLAIASGTALLLSVAAIAAPTETESTVQSASAKSQPQKIICHYIGHEGSVLPKPVCGTQAAWDKERIRVEKELADYQLRSNSTPAH